MDKWVFDCGFNLKISEEQLNPCHPRSIILKLKWHTDDADVADTHGLFFTSHSKLHEFHFGGGFGLLGLGEFF
jgi:hypothetical protein